jgi:site-specific DNA-methyltransferase (adenine-specific)
VRPLNNVYCCDWRQLTKEIPDKAISVVILDPPFGQSIGKMNFTQSTKGGVAKRTDFSKHDLTWDESPLTADDLTEICRVSRNQIIFGGNYIANLLPPSRCWIAWDKRTADKYSNDFADMELAWTSFNRPARIVRFLWSGMLQGDMKHKEKRFHPCQKPVKMYSQIIEQFSQPGDVVGDFFCGAGGCLIAARDLGRQFIGCDKDPNYVNITKARLAAPLALAA